MADSPIHLPLRAREPSARAEQIEQRIEERASAPPARAPEIDRRAGDGLLLPGAAAFDRGERILRPPPCAQLGAIVAQRPHLQSERARHAIRRAALRGRATSQENEARHSMVPSGPACDPRKRRGGAAALARASRLRAPALRDWPISGCLSPGEAARRRTRRPWRAQGRTTDAFQREARRVRRGALGRAAPQRSGDGGELHVPWIRNVHAATTLDGGGGNTA